MNIKQEFKTEDVQEVCQTDTAVGKADKKKRPKSNKRRRMRRLADRSTLLKNSISVCKRVLIGTGLFIFAIAILVGNYCAQNHLNTRQIFKEFLKNYHNQYIEIIHGKQNYCDPQRQLEVSPLTEHVKPYGILNQEKALQEIEVTLRNKSDINVIALVGSVGVGKSLFMKYMVENFPWQENVQTYAWNTYTEKEEDKYNYVRLLVENLSECGQNLMVIENLKPCDREVVTSINNQVKQSLKKEKKRVVIFYVFNLNTMLPKAEYTEQLNSVQTLVDCNVITFKSFSENEIRDCIQREAEFEKLVISPDDADEIVNLIDPFKSGCKNVNAKVRMYGKRLNKDFL